MLAGWFARQPAWCVRFYCFSAGAIPGFLAARPPPAAGQRCDAGGTERSGRTIFGRGRPGLAWPAAVTLDSIAIPSPVGPWWGRGARGQRPRCSQCSHAQGCAARVREAGAARAARAGRRQAPRLGVRPRNSGPNRPTRLSRIAASNLCAGVYGFYSDNAPRLVPPHRGPRGCGLAGRASAYCLINRPTPLGATRGRGKRGGAGRRRPCRSWAPRRCHLSPRSPPRPPRWGGTWPAWPAWRGLRAVEVAGRPRVAPLRPATPWHCHGHAAARARYLKPFLPRRREARSAKAVSRERALAPPRPLHCAAPPAPPRPGMPLARLGRNVLFPLRRFFLFFRRAYGQLSAGIWVPRPRRPATALLRDLINTGGGGGS